MIIALIRSLVSHLSYIALHNEDKLKGRISYAGKSPVTITIGNARCSKRLEEQGAIAESEVDGLFDSLKWSCS